MVWSSERKINLSLLFTGILFGIIISGILDSKKEYICTMNMSKRVKKMLLTCIVLT